MGLYIHCESSHCWKNIDRLQRQRSSYMWVPRNQRGRSRCCCCIDLLPPRRQRHIDWRHYIQYGSEVHRCMQLSAPKGHMLGFHQHNIRIRSRPLNRMPYLALVWRSIRLDADSRWYGRNCLRNRSCPWPNRPYPYPKTIEGCNTCQNSTC